MWRLTWDNGDATRTSTTVWHHFENEFYPPSHPAAPSTAPARFKENLTQFGQVALSTVVVRSVRRSSAMYAAAVGWAAAHRGPGQPRSEDVYGAGRAG